LFTAGSDKTDLRNSDSVVGTGIADACSPNNSWCALVAAEYTALLHSSADAVARKRIKHS